MHPLVFALVMLIAVAIPSHAAGEARVTQTLAVPAGEAHGADHGLRLHLYLFRGSRWQPEDVMRALPGVSALLAQCGVSTAPVELHIVEAPRRYHAYSTPVSRQLLRALPVAKPAIFFVDDTLNRPAYDAETIGLANSRSRPELAHTIWVAHGARDLPHALAHELVHLLSNSGEHSTAPGNLMRAETSAASGTLSSAQCAAAVSQGTAQGLLVARSQ